MVEPSSILTSLMTVIQERKSRPPTERSYVATLMQGGVAKIGGKIVEEAAEVVEAGDEPGEAGKDHLVKEVADLLFHAMVLLGYRDIPGAKLKPSSPADSASAASPRKNPALPNLENDPYTGLLVRLPFKRGWGRSRRRRRSPQE